MSGSKTFYKADKIQMKWNKSGTNLLFLTQTEVDKTGKSYYGESNLYLMAAAGQFDCRVTLGESFTSSIQTRDLTPRSAEQTRREVSTTLPGRPTTASSPLPTDVSDPRLSSAPERTS
jgi:hypothetical protein